MAVPLLWVGGWGLCQHRSRLSLPHTVKHVHTATGQSMNLSFALTYKCNRMSIIMLLLNLDSKHYRFTRPFFSILDLWDQESHFCIISQGLQDRAGPLLPPSAVLYPRIIHTQNDVLGALRGSERVIESAWVSHVG